MYLKLSGVNILLTRALLINPVSNLVKASVLFCIGCCCVLFVRDLVAVEYLFIALFLLLCISYWYPLFRVLVLILLGFIWITLTANQALNKQLPTEFEKKQVHLTVDIVDFPKGNTSYITFTAKIVQAKHGNQLILQPNALIRLSCYRCDEVFLLGERVVIEAVLRRPRGSQSWGSFDFERHALHQGISATGYIKKVNNKIDRADSPIFLMKVRERIRNHLQESSQGETSLAILSALSIGDRSAFTTDIWRVLRVTGLTHIVAISGLHIGFIFFALRCLIRKVLNLLYPIYLTVPAVYLESFFALLGAAAYAALAGFTVPTQRALIMLMIYFITLFSPRKFGLIPVLCITIGIIMLIDPLAILATSFWLSVSAVLLIGLAQLTRKRSIVYFQCFLSLAMAPIVIGFFSEVSLISPVLNLIVVPLISLVVLPSLLLSFMMLELFPRLGHWLLSQLSQAIEFVWGLLLWLENTMPLLSINLVMNSRAYIISLLIVLTLIFWSILPNKRFVVLILILVILVKPANSALNHGEFIVTVLDVGQGLAVVIETPKGVSIFDTGSGYAQSDSAQKTIIPYLRSLNDKRLQSLIISHFDSDHAGGMNTLIQHYSFERFMAPEKAGNGFFITIPSEKCHQGIVWQESGVSFKILAPSLDFKVKRFSRNNRSCVLLIQSAWGSVLLPGDIEREMEHQLIERFDEQLDVDVLVLAHHGSITSSSPAFLQRVKPSIAISSSAYLSRHGHPHEKVVSRVKKMQAKLFNTATSGSVKIRFLESGLQATEYRAKQRRFWYASD